MKITAIISLLFICLLAKTDAKAQQLEVQAYMQETVMGMQNGYSIKRMSENGMKLGLFHQSNRILSFTEGSSNYPYTGAEISYPLTNCGKLRLYANLKAGLLNNQFILTVPEIESVLKINSFMSFSFASSYRAGQAALSLKANFLLF
ncbi:MAG: hypothetical protein WBA74_06445 [Cyclobacteriaceae bacterium]